MQTISHKQINFKLETDVSLLAVPVFPIFTSKLSKYTAPALKI